MFVTRFVERSTEDAFIQFVGGNGCSSTVGRTGEKQEVTLGDGCVGVGTIIHELMHAIGKLLQIILQGKQAKQIKICNAPKVP